MDSDFATGYALGQDNNGCGGFGGWGEGLWAIIILAMLGLGGGYGGFGGFGGGAALQGIATRADINEGFALSNITGSLNGLQRSVDHGFCDTNYNLATQACDIKHAIGDSTRAILDYLTGEKLDTLRLENQTLRFQASQAAQNQFITQVGSDIVQRLQPPPVPAYVVANPYAGYGYGYGYNSYGCGCGC